MEPTAIYIRVSSEDKDDPSQSPDNQKKLCLKILAERDWDLFEIILDSGKSGKDFNRKGAKKLIELIKNKKIKRVLFKDWSRLIRNAELQSWFARLCAENQAEIVSCDGIKEKKVWQITGLTNEWYIDEARAKVELVHAQKRSEGIPLNRPPVGYHLDKKARLFVPNKDSARVVSAFEMASNGSSIQEISKSIEFHSKDNKSKYRMTANGIKKMLRNKTYLGFMCYRGEWSKGRHQPIISEGLFQKVQEKLNKKRNEV